MSSEDSPFQTKLIVPDGTSSVLDSIDDQSILHSGEQQPDAPPAGQRNRDPQYVTQINRRKIALVTGSGTGIGANISTELVNAGYTVIVTGRDSANLNNIVQRCNKLAGFGVEAAIAFRADLYDMIQVDKLVEFIHDKYHKLDLLVNNACWRGLSKNILDTDTLDDMRKVLHLNVSIPFYLIQKCILIKHRATDRSVILNISSAASQVVVPLHSYSISKACIAELGRQIAFLGQHDRYKGLFCATIAPGPVLTDERPHHAEMSQLTLLKRVGTTQEIAHVVMFVLENIELMNGKEVSADGGYSARQIKK